jgi:hypothetical protein
MINDSFNSARDTCKDFGTDFVNFIDALKGVADKNSVDIQINPDLNVKAWEEVSKLLDPWTKGQLSFDPSKYNSIMMLTNNGKGWNNKSTYVNDILNSIDGATANVSNTNNNKVTSNTTNNTTNQTINVTTTEPMSKNDIYKLERDWKLTAI